MDYFDSFTNFSILVNLLDLQFLHIFNKVYFYKIVLKRILMISILKSDVFEILRQYCPKSLMPLLKKWTYNAQGVNSFNSYQVVTYPHKIYLQHSMATWCDNYSPLHDQFWLAMQLSETVSRINRATNTDDPCSTSGDSISNCLCNFRHMTIKSRPNIHMNCKRFKNWNGCVCKWKVPKTHYKWTKISLGEAAMSILFTKGNKFKSSFLEAFEAFKAL